MSISSVMNSTPALTETAGQSFDLIREGYIVLLDCLDENDEVSIANNYMQLLLHTDF